MNENTSNALLVALIGTAALLWDKPAAFVLAVVTCGLATVTCELRSEYLLGISLVGWVPGEKARRRATIGMFVAALSWVTAVAAFAALFI